MLDETAALHFNSTWDLFALLQGKSAVGCRRIYTVKIGPNGHVDGLKALLVNLSLKTFKTKKTKRNKNFPLK